MIYLLIVITIILILTLIYAINQNNFIIKTVKGSIHSLPLVNIGVCKGVYLNTDKGRLLFLIDTGAMGTVIYLNTLDKLYYYKIEKEASYKDIFTAVGRNKTLSAIQPLTIKVFGTTTTSEVNYQISDEKGNPIVPNNMAYNGLLGCDFLKSLGARVDYHNNIIYFDKPTII